MSDLLRFLWQWRKPSPSGDGDGNSANGIHVGTTESPRQKKKSWINNSIPHFSYRCLFSKPSRTVPRTVERPPQMSFWSGFEQRARVNNPDLTRQWDPELHWGAEERGRWGEWSTEMWGCGGSQQYGGGQRGTEERGKNCHCNSWGQLLQERGGRVELCANVTRGRKQITNGRAPRTEPWGTPVMMEGGIHREEMGNSLRACGWFPRWTLSRWWVMVSKVKWRRLISESEPQSSLAKTRLELSVQVVMG